MAKAGTPPTAPALDNTEEEERSPAERQRKRRMQPRRGEEGADH